MVEHALYLYTALQNMAAHYDTRTIKDCPVVQVFGSRTKLPQYMYHSVVPRERVTVIRPNLFEISHVSK